jgi:carbonic anhydrase
LTEVACATGSLQSPINLDTNIKVHDEFHDNDFDFKYETIDPPRQLKYNQGSDAFYFAINKEEQSNDSSIDMSSWMKTATINLFDKHIR